MGLLEDIGRTNTLGNQMNAISNLALNIRQQGQNEKTIALNERGMAVREGQFNINKELADRQKAEYEAKQKDLDTVYPLEPFLKSLPPSSAKLIDEFLEKNQLKTDIGGVAGITKGNSLKARELVGNNLLLQKDVDLAALSDTRNAIEQIQQQLQDPKLKDKDAAALQQQLQDAYKLQQVYLNSVNAMDKDIRKAVAVEKAKAKSQTTQKSDIVTWLTPDGKVVNLRKGVMPPEGSQRAPSRAQRETISDTDDSYKKKRAAFIYKNKRPPTPPEDEELYQKAADDVKRQSPKKAGEVVAEKEEQKRLATAFNTAMEEGIPAQGNKWRIQQARKAIEKGGAFTGKLSPVKKWISEYYQAITGKTPKGLPESQMLTAIANRSALLLVGASQGKEGGMPANLFSEADREFVVASTFNPTQTPEGISKLMEISEKAEDYRLMKAKVFREYKKSHKGKLDAGVYDVLASKMKELYPTEDEGNVRTGGTALTPEQEAEKFLRGE